MDNTGELRELKNRLSNFNSFLRKPTNVVIISILVLALIIRLYFLIHTHNQTLWWDEAEYMSTAVHWAFNVPYDLNPQRPPLFQLIESIFLSLGITESFIKLLLVVFPSVFLVFAIYLLGKELYDEKIAIVGAIFAAISWNFIFWSARLQPDFISMVFQVFAILFMWKYWKAENYKFVILSGIFSAFGFYFKVSGLLVPMIFIVFILIKDGFSAIKNKGYYIYSAAFLATLIPYFIWAKYTFGKLTAFSAGYVDAPSDFAIGWYNLRFYYFLTENILFVLFIVGVIIGLRFLLYIDIMIKDKKKMLNADLFGIIALLFISAFYIFYMRNTDDRWVFLWLPFIFLFAGSTVHFIYEKLKKYNSQFAVLIVLIILTLTGYLQIQHASTLIDAKKDSYSPVRDAGIWMKENSNASDIVSSISITQITYYSQRGDESYSLVKSEEEFSEFVKEKNPRYIHISFFEPHPSFMLQRGQQNGLDYIILPYFNSTIASKEGKIVLFDLKQEVERDGIKYRYVYPTDKLDGTFIYEVMKN